MSRGVLPTRLRFMNKYKNAHWWLLLALAIVILGFVRSYWSKFPHVDFGHHLHLLSATAWGNLDQ